MFPSPGDSSAEPEEFRSAAGDAPAPDLWSWPADDVWQRDLGVASAGEPSSAVGITAPPVAVQEVEPERVAVAGLAAAAAALAGGLVWAGVVIATRLDIGILAWLVGGATGLVMVRVAGRPIGTAGRVLAGSFAAAAIFVGKYVIFVHDVKDVMGAQLAALGQSVGYLDTRQMSIFVHNTGSIVGLMYALWISLAFVAAVRTAAGQSLIGRRR